MLPSTQWSSMTTQASGSASKCHRLSSSSRNRPLNDSIHAFCQGEPGSMKIVFTLLNRHQSETARATINGSELLVDHDDVLSIGRQRSRPNAATCDVLQPPAGEFTDRRLSGEAFCQCAVSLVRVRFGDVAVTRGNGERPGLAGRAADSAIGLSPHRDPDLAGPVEDGSA